MERTPVSLLVRLKQDGASEAWACFVDLFAPLLDRWAHALGLQDADASDLVQDVFCVLLRRLPHFSYDPGRSFRAWLWTVLHNAWRDRIQRRAVPVQSPEALDRFASPDGVPEAAEEEYRRYLIGRAVQVLQRDFQPATWQAFWELVVAGRPAVEVARQLGITVNAAYLARSRVLTRLRQELAGLDI
jgi:RNA polymerase sigma-70 factor (ECF subfamily)